MAIELSNVQFYYPEQPTETVFNIPSWSLSGGDHAFIYGPSGCGKSTLLNLMSGLLLPCEGRITILDQRLDKMNGRQRDRFRANHIGYVFQQFNLIPYLSAVENIQLANQFSRRCASSVLKAEIISLLCTLNIAEQDWHKPACRLSSGQQQRVAIARALINKPKLLIADEPTSSLDAHNTNAFMTLLMSMVSEHDITLVLVSHDLSLAHYFNRVDDLHDLNQKKDLT